VYIVVLTPVLDDWVAARELLARLDAAFASPGETVSVLLVDDGSTEAPPPDFGLGPYAHLRDVDILKLKKNVGHQRALAIGLCHIEENVACDAVVVMDSDGEDNPADAVRLVQKLEEVGQAARPIVFAERTRRSESFIFRLGYVGYRLLHYILTGRGIRFGNFSIVPRNLLPALTVEPTLWNHYAASVAGSRLPYISIPSHRGARIAGQSHQSLVRLVVHGLSALSCYSEMIGVRLLIMALFLLVLTVILIAATIILKLISHIPLPGWSSLFAAILLVFLFQVVTLASNFTMQIISLRSAQPFLPARDYGWYVDGVKACFHRDHEPESDLRRPGA
jgi:hypothetical protein